jgi:predicted dehydrogenase
MCNSAVATLASNWWILITENTDCQLYGDFRELLERPDIDAVLVATGDRWHAAASILAAQAGKDVYSEKPCGITIQACQELADVMHREQRVFQAGTQRRSVPNFQMAVELAHSGKLGKLHTLHASIYVPVLDNTWLPAETTPPRDVVDWNLWLGPAAWRPFNQKYVDGRWRGQWDFDSGARVLDWGAHTVDLCQWANQADDTMPIEYEPTPEKHSLPLREWRETGDRFPQGSLRRSFATLHHPVGNVSGPLHRGTRGRLRPATKGNWSSLPRP